MNEQDALDAYNEWWNVTGNDMLRARRCGIEYDAFLAGAEWQRERDAGIAESVGSAPKVRDGRADEATQIAQRIRKGEQ